MVDRSRISQRVATRSLYAFTYGDSRRFPIWQFTGERTLPGLKAVLASRMLNDPALSAALANAATELNTVVS